MTNYILLLPVLVFAMVSDIRTHKIPNALCVYGIVAALVYWILADTDAIFYKLLPGMCIPFFVLFCLYVIRALGAGDVKLMCVVGTYIGVDVLMVIGLTFVITAIYGIVVCIRHIGEAIKQGMYGGRRQIEQCLCVRTRVCFSIPIFCAVLIYMLKEVCIGGI